LQYAVLTIAIIDVLLIFVTLAVCIITPISKKKWLWIVFILVGVGSVSVNWTNGKYAIQVLSIYLFGASAAATGPDAPWIITATIPLGAIVFWFKRKRLKAEAEASIDSEQPESDVSER